MLAFLMIRLTKLLVVIAFGGSVAYVVPVRAQTLKNEPDRAALSPCPLMTHSGHSV
jgi:hypothetical protein